MPNASPRYSPTGSRLSVKPKACSQPILYVPPAPTWLLVRPAPPAATRTAAPTPATARAIASLRIGLFTESSLLPTSHDAGIAVTGRFDDEHQALVSHRSARTSNASRRPSPSRL